MPQGNVERAVELLLKAREGGEPLPGLGEAMPKDEAEVWAIQLEVLRRTGGSIGGWKCATPPGKPHSAAIMAAGGRRASPAVWKSAGSRRIGIETEIAFRLKRDLPKRAAPYGKDEVLDAMEAAFPLVELVQSRYVDMFKVTPAEAMADCVAHLGFVVGADVADWRRFDLKNLKVRQSYGGTVQVEKVGGNPSDDPLVPLVWLANHLHGFGLHLSAGQVVTTGSCTGATFVHAGERVVAGFEGFGTEVVVDLA